MKDGMKVKPHSIVFNLPRLLFPIPLLIAFLPGSSIGQPTMQGNPVAIIPPFLDRLHRDDWESTLQLARQEFVVFLYHNAAVVYSEADFVNTGTDTLRVELGLPSTGYTIGKGLAEQDISSGVFGIQLWVSSERVKPKVHQGGDAEWVTVTPTFTPQIQTTVKALFWAETTIGGDSGDRAIGIPLSQSAIWKDLINSIDVTVVLREGLVSSDSLFQADPDPSSVEDSVLTWSFSEIEPNTDQDISILYHSSRNQALNEDERESLSRSVIEHAYDEILEYARESDEE
jgi:hypothetical protein